MSRELKACPLCETEQLRSLYLTSDRHYGIPGLYKIVQCAGCSLIFLNPLVCDEELSTLYPTDYYAYQDNPRNGSRWRETLKRVVGARIRTRDPQFDVPGRMLDLGCGTGWFLREMRDKGWDVHGVEINARAAESGRTHAGLDIFAGTLQEANFPSSFFDYVRANHSFEHIACPDETLDEIQRILRPGGKVLIGVPNVAGLNARIFRQYWWYLGAPVHPFTYSDTTLSQMLIKHRFDVTGVTYNSNYGGNLGSCQILLNRNNGRKSSEGALINNLALKLICQWIAKLTDAFKAGDAIELVAAKRGSQS